MIKYILFMILNTLYLFARTNPFEPIELSIQTSSKEQIIEKKPIEGVIISDDDGNRTIKLKSYDKMPTSLQKPSQKINDNNSTQIITQPIVESLPNIKKEKKPVKENTKVETPTKPKALPKPKLIEKTYKPFSFVTISLKKDKLHIKAWPKYTVLQYFCSVIDDKIIIDFDAKVEHTTKNEKFISEEFESYTIGNHPDEKFFRVVIKTKHKPKQYLPIIQNNEVTISYPR